VYTPAAAKSSRVHPWGQPSRSYRRTAAVCGDRAHAKGTPGVAEGARWGLVDLFEVHAGDRGTVRRLAFGPPPDRPQSAPSTMAEFGPPGNGPPGNGGLRRYRQRQGPAGVAPPRSGPLGDRRRCRWRRPAPRQPPPPVPGRAQSPSPAGTGPSATDRAHELARRPRVCRLCCRQNSSACLDSATGLRTRLLDAHWLSSRPAGDLVQKRAFLRHPRRDVCRARAVRRSAVGPDPCAASGGPPRSRRPSVARECRTARPALAAHRPQTPSAGSSGRPQTVRFTPWSQLRCGRFCPVRGHAGTSHEPSPSRGRAEPAHRRSCPLKVVEPP
jgi:hypothetical protein